MISSWDGEENNACVVYVCVCVFRFFGRLFSSDWRERGKKNSCVCFREGFCFCLEERVCKAGYLLPTLQSTGRKENLRNLERDWDHTFQPPETCWGIFSMTWRNLQIVSYSSCSWRSPMSVCVCFWVQWRFSLNSPILQFHTQFSYRVEMKFYSLHYPRVHTERNQGKRRLWTRHLSRGWSRGLGLRISTYCAFLVWEGIAMENLCNRKPFLLWCIALDVNKYKCGPWTPIVTGIPNLQDVVHGLCKSPAFARQGILLGISLQNVILICLSRQLDACRNSLWECSFLF